MEANLPRPTPGSLTIVAGPTNVGKSFFLLALLAEAARRDARPSLYVSLEDPELEVGRRCSSGLGHAGLMVSVPDRNHLSDVVGLITEAGRAGMGWVGVDYLQLVAYDGGVQAWSKADAVSRTTAELKAEAKRAGVALALGCQLRRAGQGELNTFPSLHTLKESGDLENMAEFVIMLGANARGVKAVALKVKSGPVGASQRYVRGQGGVLEPVRAGGVDDE